MPHMTKIATCCYCGTRAALVLKGRGRHELACSACGAPLHEMKTLRSDHGRSPHREVVKPSPLRGTKAKQIKRDKFEIKRGRKKKKKGRLKDMFEDVFDVFEDIFD